MKGEGRQLDTQLNLRVGADDLERLERLAEALNARTPGMNVNRSAAARAAILRGLEALEAELGITAKTKRARS